MIHFHDQTTNQVLPALVILTFLNTRQKFFTATSEWWRSCSHHLFQNTYSTLL